MVKLLAFAALLVACNMGPLPVDEPEAAITECVGPVVAGQSCEAASGLCAVCNVPAPCLARLGTTQGLCVATCDDCALFLK